MNAKAALLAFTCILIAGISNATADELLDLETRDLAEMKTVSGTGQDKHGLYAAPVHGIVAQPKRLNNAHYRALRRTAGSRRNSRRSLGPLESEAVLHIADIARRDSSMGEGFFDLILSRHRALGSHSSRGEKRCELRWQDNLRERKRDNHQRRYQCD